jgi:hypothetical protein
MMYIIYDLHIKVDEIQKAEFDDFMNYFQSILHKYEEENRKAFKMNPIYFLLLNEDDPFYNEYENDEMKVLKEFYVYEYVKKKYEIKLSVFMVDKNNHYDHDIFESWLLHISRKFPLLHIYLYYYHIYERNIYERNIYERNIYERNIYDDDVLYMYIHQNRMIESSDVLMDDYYLKKYGKELLNSGFYILYPIYKELISKNPDYYKNYEHRFYKILRDPYLMFQSSSNRNQLFEHMISPKYKHYRPLFYKFHEFLDTHTAIRQMIIDETTLMIGKYKERPIIYFQSKMRHKIKLKRVHQQLYLVSLLPPLSKEELIYLQFDKICKIKPVFINGRKFTLS